MYVNKKERGSETFLGTSMVVTDVLSIVYLYTSLFNTCKQFRIHSSKCTVNKKTRVVGIYKINIVKTLDTLQSASTI